MHAYIVIGRDKEILDEKIQKIVTEVRANPIEYAIDNINAVRELIRTLKLVQPVSTAIILRNVDDATPEALNAFLKNLEEPGKNITFVLTAENENKVLPTIISRCQIIRLGTKTSDYQNNDIDLFLRSTTGERLSMTDTIKKREDAIDFTQNLLLYIEALIKRSDADLLKLARIAKITQATLDNLNRNGNVNLQLTDMIVKLDKLSLFDSMDKV